MEAEVAKQKHDDIVQNAIEQGKAMQPILEKQKEKELAEVKEADDEKKAIKKKEDNEL